MQHLGSEELQRVWRNILAETPPEERLEDLSPEERLKGLLAEEVLKCLSRRNWSVCGSCCKRRPK